MGGTQPALLDQIVLPDEVIDQPQRGGQGQRRKVVVLLPGKTGDSIVASQQMPGLVDWPRGLVAIQPPVHSERHVVAQVVPTRSQWQVVDVDDAGHLLAVGEDVPTVYVSVDALRCRGQRLDDRVPSRPAGGEPGGARMRLAAPCAARVAASARARAASA